MADARCLGNRRGETLPGETVDVVAGGTATIDVGDVIIPDDGNPGYWRKVANGEISTEATEVRVAITASDETAGADGTCEAFVGAEMVISMVATTPANLVQAVIGTKVTVDVTAGVITVDENDTTNGFLEILRPPTGAAGFDTTNGVMLVLANGII